MQTLSLIFALNFLLTLIWFVPPSMCPFWPYRSHPSIATLYQLPLIAIYNRGPQLPGHANGEHTCKCMNFHLRKQLVHGKPCPLSPPPSSLLPPMLPVHRAKKVGDRWSMHTIGREKVSWSFLIQNIKGLRLTHISPPPHSIYWKTVYNDLLYTTDI